MNPTKKKALYALAAVLGFYTLVTGLRISKAHSYQEACDPPASADHLRELGVDMPSNVQLCREMSASYGASYHVLIARTNALCVASMGAVGCPSARHEGLAWTLDMTSRGWGTGRVGRQLGESLSYELERPHTTVSLSLYESQFHEVTGLLQVSSDLPRRRVASR